jgi:hypothetical protein
MRKCAYILIEFEKIIWGGAAYNKENKNSNISRKKLFIRDITPTMICN